MYLLQDVLLLLTGGCSLQILGCSSVPVPGKPLVELLRMHTIQTQQSCAQALSTSKFATVQQLPLRSDPSDTLSAPVAPHTLLADVSLPAVKTRVQWGSRQSLGIAEMLHA